MLKVYNDIVLYSECGEGPKLVSFRGRAKDYTPRARVRSWLGYCYFYDRKHSLTFIITDMSCHLIDMIG